MKIKWKQLIIALIIPLAVGGVSAILSMGSMDTFKSLEKPPLSPPGWIFPVVWTILFLLMGFASYLVSLSPKTVEKRRALFIYGLQLIVNFFWSILFLNLENYLGAFIWIILLLVLILVTAYDFSKISKLAGRLLIPYILWVLFAGYLNLFIYLLN